MNLTIEYYYVFSMYDLNFSKEFNCFVLNNVIFCLLQNFIWIWVLNVRIKDDHKTTAMTWKDRKIKNTIWCQKAFKPITYTSLFKKNRILKKNEICECILYIPAFYTFIHTHILYILCIVDNPDEMNYRRNALAHFFSILVIFFREIIWQIWWKCNDI